MPGISFPNIDPVAFEIGPLAIRWYALAYIAGILLGWRYCQDFGDFMIWAVLGIILGGRIGYVVFYNAAQYLQNPSRLEGLGGRNVVPRRSHRCDRRHRHILLATPLLAAGDG